MNSEDYIVPTGQIHPFEYKPCYDIKFHRDGKTIGTLDFNGPALVFTGEAEESAKVFIDWLAELFMGRLEQERAAERQWVGLTLEEVDELDCVKLMWQDYESCEIHGIKEFARAIEAKLREKNT